MSVVPGSLIVVAFELSSHTTEGSILHRPFWLPRPSSADKCCHPLSVYQLTKACVAKMSCVISIDSATQELSLKATTRSDPGTHT